MARKQKNIADNDICNIVRTNEQNHLAGSTQLSKYVNFSLAENIDKIDAYLNSKHISGDTDDLGREKPFFNICTAAVNITYRATDIDRKNIQIKPTKTKNVIGAFLLAVHLQNWMKKARFGVFLNTWGIALARYGSSIVKFITNDEGFHAEVIPWNRTICDPIAFDNDVMIEVLEFTPAQLKKKKGYDQKMVDDLISATSARQLAGGQTKDTKANFIKVYEVHGELPLSFITGREADEDTYAQQMQVISFVEKKDKTDEYDDFVLVKGKEKKHPYMITHLIEEDGRTQSIGAVENLFEALWMMNHSVKSIKDQLDLASKLIFQTSDAKFMGQNAINAIETGDILIHAVNQPITQVNNNSHDIASQQSFQAQWKALGNEINGISESMLGSTAPSGTAWRQVEALLQESHSLFEIMTENKGLAIEDMMRTYVIPYLLTKMDTTEEVAMTMTQYNIDKINKMYVPNEAIRRTNKKIATQIFNDEIAQPADIPGETQKIQSEMQNGVFFSPEDVKGKTWKSLFKEIVDEVEIEITGESSDKQAMLTTLNITLQTLVGLAGKPMTPDVKMVLNKILTTTGLISPLEMAEVKQEPVATPVVGGVDATAIKSMMTAK